jgi:nucleoside-diphosphate-sugar epimerase
MASVLVTGGAGFVGLNLLEALLGRGEDVVAFGREDALPPAASALFATLPGRLTLVQGDVLDAGALRALFKAHAIDRIFPFAAITAGPAREASSPGAIIDVNLKGLIATLEAARDAGGVRRVILPSSAAVYGESAYDHALLDEATTPCVPISLYGVTKYAVERAGLRLAQQWGLDAIAARIGAAFGPWERDTGVRDTLSPHLAIATLAKSGGEAVLPATVHGYDWVYVRDLAAGLLALMEAKAPPARVFNLASGRDWSPHLDACCAAMAGALPGFRWRRAATGEAPGVAFPEIRPRGVMNIGRARGIGWAPRFTPEAAYADYAAWMKTT